LRRAGEELDVSSLETIPAETHNPLMVLPEEGRCHSRAKPFGNRGTMAMTKIQHILSKDRVVKKAKGK
jgi:hypothetical protein